MDEEKYMKRAIELAKKGLGYTSPNPMVGAVIVKDGKIIGEGYHEKYGQLHAERNAIASLKESPKGATMYVTLEPCCHYGKTPPCTSAIIESGISKVVIGSRDPNPKVSGKGIEILKNHGIETICDFMKKECDEINPVFFHYISSGTPFVLMKYAMTIDGKIATYSGKSKWITGEEARNSVHLTRHAFKGIMVGVGTVLSDDPLLTCRIEGGRNPIRIVCDTNLRTPLDSKLVKSAMEVPLIIGTASKDENKKAAFKDLGCLVIDLPLKDDHVDLKAFMRILGEHNIDSILLEGGGILNWSALNAGIVNRVNVYIAPKIFGGINSKTPVAGKGVEDPNNAFQLTNSKVHFFGDDIMIDSEVKICSQE